MHPPLQGGRAGGRRREGAGEETGHGVPSQAKGSAEQRTPGGGACARASRHRQRQRVGGPGPAREPNVDGACGGALLLGQPLHQLLLKRHIRLDALRNHLGGGAGGASGVCVRTYVCGYGAEWCKHAGPGCRGCQPQQHHAGMGMQPVQRRPPRHAPLRSLALARQAPPPPPPSPPCQPRPRPHLLVHKQPRVVARGGRLELGPALHLVAGHPHQRVLAHQHLAGCGQRAAEVLQLLHGQALVPQAHHHRAALQQALQLLHSLLLALPADRCLYLQARQAGWPGRRRCRWVPQEWQRVQGQGLQGVGQGHASHSSARAQGRPGGRSSGGGRLPSGARRDAPEGCHDAAARPAARAGRLPAVPLLPWRSCCWRRPGGTCVQFYVGIVKCASPEPSRACVVVPAPHAPALCPAHRAHAAWPPAGSSPDSTDCNPRIQAAWDGMPGPAYGLAAWVMHMRTLPQEGWQRPPPPLRCWLAEGSTWQNGEALGRASAPCSSGAPCVRGQRMGFGGLAAT